MASALNTLKYCQLGLSKLDPRHTVIPLPRQWLGWGGGGGGDHCVMGKTASCRILVGEMVLLERARFWNPSHHLKCLHFVH